LEVGITGAIQGPFHQSLVAGTFHQILVAIDPVVFEEKIKM
jgi:hypothetical protein